MANNWRDVEGYDGLYQVNNLGRIRSFHNQYERIHVRDDEEFLGKNVFANHGLTVMSVETVTIEDGVMFGPEVGLFGENAIIGTGSVVKMFPTMRLLSAILRWSSNLFRGGIATCDANLLNNTLIFF